MIALPALGRDSEKIQESSGLRRFLDAAAIDDFRKREGARNPHPRYFGWDKSTRRSRSGTRRGIRHAEGGVT
ncbi:MAG: hypothetical protein OXU68_15355 [Bacteroidota bacterium]|nr:hypothetical protein [Bacteroidota bacterium]